MIKADQPTIFPANVLVRVSSVSDGSMKDGADLMTPEAIEHRQRFIEQCGLSSDQAAVHFADFATDDYCVYEEAHPGYMSGADGIVTQTVGQPLFLPTADCAPTVLYDPIQNVLMLSHLGRHSVEQHGGTRSVEHLVGKYGSHPQDILVWVGPSPSEHEYPLWAFANRSFREVVAEQLSAAGIQKDNIELSLVESDTNPDYFSHSRFLRGQQTIDGRFGTVASLV